MRILLIFPSRDGMGLGPYPDHVGPDPNLRVCVQLFQTLRIRVQVNFLGLES